MLPHSSKTQSPRRKPVYIPEIANEYFEVEHAEDYDLPVHFTRESWNGRMKACRGVAASLTPEETAAWEREHIEMLEKSAPAEFDILHHAAMAVLKKR